LRLAPPTQTRSPPRINQAAVPKMELRADMYISTLQSMIRAMGGRLKIEAVFSEGEVEINQFRKLKKTGGRIESEVASPNSWFPPLQKA
jgi:hypothetical protein